jgi:hypothetical protein
VRLGQSVMMWSMMVWSSSRSAWRWRSLGCRSGGVGRRAAVIGGHRPQVTRALVRQPGAPCKGRTVAPPLTCGFAWVSQGLGATPPVTCAYGLSQAGVALSHWSFADLLLEVVPLLVVGGDRSSHVDLVDAEHPCEFPVRGHPAEASDGLDHLCEGRRLGV